MHDRCAPVRVRVPVHGHHGVCLLVQLDELVCVCERARERERERQRETERCLDKVSL